MCNSQLKAGRSQFRTECHRRDELSAGAKAWLTTSWRTCISTERTCQRVKERGGERRGETHEEDGVKFSVKRRSELWLTNSRAQPVLNGPQTQLLCVVCKLMIATLSVEGDVRSTTVLFIMGPFWTFI